MVKRDLYGSRCGDPRQDYTPSFRIGYGSEQEPDIWERPDKYDPDGFWDGETLDDDNIDLK